MWRDQVLHKRAMNTNTEISIWRIVGCKNKEQCQKIEIYYDRMYREIGKDGKKE
jgi:hypothetical protein